nr:hypothetical protein Iba_chr13fCG4840 [Ipomoea batatas]
MVGGCACASNNVVPVGQVTGCTMEQCCRIRSFPVPNHIIASKPNFPAKQNEQTAALFVKLQQVGVLPSTVTSLTASGHAQTKSINRSTFFFTSSFSPLPITETKKCIAVIFPLPATRISPLSNSIISLAVSRCPFCRARCNGLRPSQFSFLENDGVKLIISAAKMVLPCDAATCSGVSANGVSSISLRIFGLSRIVSYRISTLFSLAAVSKRDNIFFFCDSEMDNIVTVHECKEQSSALLLLAIYRWAGRHTYSDIIFFKYILSK